ncbi:MAG: AAA family ATPase [Kofleriaceae bacterium]
MRNPDERELRSELAFEALLGVQLHARVALLAEVAASAFDQSLVCPSICAAEHLFSADGGVVQASATVLIDEVDAHLHPTWQRTIGQWLLRYFPNVQFLVTTHSPLICQAAEAGSVFLLPRPGSGESGEMLRGDRLQRLLYGNVLDAYSTGAFGEGVTRSDAALDKLERLAALNAAELQGQLSKQEQDEQDELRRIMPTAASVA